MANEHNFKPYGCVISNALFNAIDGILCKNESDCIKGEFNIYICDIVVSFLSIPISIIIEHGSYQTMVTVTSLTSSHSVLHTFPSVVGDTQAALVGNEAINQLSPLSLNHPISNGIITKYSLLQIDMIWNYIFTQLLSHYNVTSHAILIILPPQTMCNISICDKMIQLLFTVYNVPALAIMNKPSLSCHYYCYSSPQYCKKTGLVVDLGHDICTITPVFNFTSDNERMVATKLFSAKSLEQYICNLLKENQCPSQIANRLKEIQNIKKNYIKIAESRAHYDYMLSNYNWSYDGIEYVSVSMDHELHCWIADSILYDVGEFIFNPYPYEISFPHYIDVSHWIEPKCAFKLKRFTMNQNDKYSYTKRHKKRYNENGESETETEEDECVLRGLPQMILDVITQYEDVERRQHLLNNVILTGGMSYIDGIGDRLQLELVDLVKDYDAVTVVVGERRDECNSICASILTSMPCMANIWLLRDEYLKDLSQNNL
eukprot:219830_1